MTEIEIREKILNLQTELEGVINLGQTEQRELSDEETTQIGLLKTQ